MASFLFYKTVDRNWLPSDFKERSTAMDQNIYQIHLKQHIGLPSIPVVKEGDLVHKGTLIGKINPKGIGACVHSSVEGKVRKVTKDYIEIDAFAEQPEDYVTIHGDTIIEKIKNAGIIGMGGAGLPTHIKLSSKLGEGGILIVNAAECEPILNHNIASIEEDPSRMLRGMKYAMEAVGVTNGVIAIKEKHVDAIEKLKIEIQQVYNDTKDNKNQGISINIHRLPDMYPMGEERAVIREVTGNLLEVNSLPVEANVVVINVETVSRITDAIELNKPVISKDVTIGGQINNENKIIVRKDVPIGTTVGSLLEGAGGILKDCGELIMGGPFTGRRTNPDEYITKTTGGIIGTMPFIKDKRKIGLLVCACGANKERLEEIANSMGSEVVGVEYCKQAVEIRGTLKCENPGKCPGQSQKVLKLRKEGAEALLISNCTDCSNTVMSIAPQLKMPVYHCSDGALRAVGMKLVRKVHLQ